MISQAMKITEHVYNFATHSHITQKKTKRKHDIDSILTKYKKNLRQSSSHLRYTQTTGYHINLSLLIKNV